MPDGGYLSIKTENIIFNGSCVKPFKVEPGQYVKISISDTGVGMDEKTQQRIFEPFFTTRKMGKGTGLGLASAYGIIKNHGGFIEVNSKKGKGTTFNILLPTSKRKAIENKKLSEALIPGEGTILLVDDENIIIDTGKEMIQKLGYNVLAVNSGKEAVEIYQEKRDEVDLVILDMIMPNMSGSETYDALKQINGGIKVILSSGYSLKGKATEIMNRGCSGFIQKPFNMKQLSLKIHEVIKN